MNARRILVVEDEATIAEEVRDTVERLGHDVVGVLDTAAEAIAFVRASPPDLVLMDIRLKGETDGVEAAFEIGQNAGVPVVFVTSHADASTLERASRSKPLGYVTKPVREVAVRAALRTAFAFDTDSTLLRVTKAQLRSALESVTDLVARVTSDGCLLAANAAAPKLLGYPKPQLLRMRLTDLVVEAERERLSARLRDVASGTAGFELAVTLVTRDGGHIPAQALSSHVPGTRVRDFWVVLQPQGRASRSEPGSSTVIACPVSATHC